jgi:hypothetical protein
MQADKKKSTTMVGQEVERMLDGMTNSHLLGMLTKSIAEAASATNCSLILVDKLLRARI